MKLFLIFILLITFSVLSAQKIKTFELKYPSDTIKEVFEGFVKKKDTTKQGSYKYYYENGVLGQEGQFEQNQLQGKWILYHENGVLKQEMFFEKGLLQGGSKTYYNDGTFLEGQKKWLHQDCHWHL